MLACFRCSVVVSVYMNVSFFILGGLWVICPPPFFFTQPACPSTFLPTLRSLATLLEFWDYVNRNSPLENTGHVRDITHMYVLNTTKNKIWRIRILRIYRLYRSAIPKYIESKKNNCKKILITPPPLTHTHHLFQYHFSCFTRYSEEVIKICYGIVSCCE